MAKTATKTTNEQKIAGEAPTGNLPAETKSKHPIVAFREYVNQRMATLEEALPPHISAKKFISVVMTALQNKPELLLCTFPSIWNACIRAAHDGLLPDGREGAIAPFGMNEEGKSKKEIATWMPMIAGFRKKIFETGKVASWEVSVVLERDEFKYARGDQPFIHHEPYFGPEDSGRVVGAYSIAKLANGEVVREVMTAFQINQIMNISKAKNGPWGQPVFYPEMAKKTVARRHYKQLPHSESLDAIFARMDQEDGLPDPETPAIDAPRRAMSSASIMDQYAGTVIDNETGEITDDPPQEVGGAVNAKSAAADKGEGDKPRSSSSTNSNTPGPATSGTEARRQEGASSSQANGDASSSTATSSADASPGAAGEAGARATETTSGAASASTEQGEMPMDDDMPEDDGDGGDNTDRPWPPGAVPTDLPEYERYLKTKIAEMTDPAVVAPWWNSQEEKDLRAACKVGAEFQRLQALAIERRKQLGAR